MRQPNECKSRWTIGEGTTIPERIILSEHARGEAKRRDIDEALVNRIASAPEQRLTVRQGREVRQSRVVDPASGKLHLIRVVVDLGPDADVIVTVYRTNKLRKYWRQP